MDKDPFKEYAYWIAGGSAGLAIVEMILLLMKVI